MNADITSQHEDEVPRVLRQFLSLLDERRYATNERISSERELAERFGVGRGVIREMISRLEVMRIVERRRNSGIFQSDVAAEGSIDALVLKTAVGIAASMEEIRELREMRGLVEIQAAALGCSRRTPEDLAELDRILRESEAALGRGESLADFDPEFHQVLVGCSRNNLLRRIAHSFYLASRERRNAYFASREQCLKSHGEHVAIRDALAAQNGERVRSLLESHLQGVENYLLDRLKSGAQSTGEENG